MIGTQVQNSTQSELQVYPLQGTRAQLMLDGAVKAAQSSGRSQRDVASELGYRSSVVLSHMSAGRVAIPVDRAWDIAIALGMNPDTFLLAVLEQRHPEIDFRLLFNISYSSGRVTSRLEAVAGCSLDELPAETRAMLEEVIAARNPRRRWLAPAELATMELIRNLRPDSSSNGISDLDREAIVAALSQS